MVTVPRPPPDNELAAPALLGRSGRGRAGMAVPAPGAPSVRNTAGAPTPHPPQLKSDPRRIAAIASVVRRSWSGPDTPTVLPPSVRVGGWDRQRQHSPAPIKEEAARGRTKGS